MKKSNRDPSELSLREMPELDLAKYRIRRSSYASRIAREGATLVHEGPSATSLAEIPEADFSTARVRRNPYASRAAESTAKLQYGRGRPRVGDEVGATIVRSLWLPEDAWKALEAESREKQTTVHALLRELVAAHLLARSAHPQAGGRRRRKG